MFDVTPSDWEAAYTDYAAGLAEFVRHRVPAYEADDLLQEVWSAYAAAVATQSIAQPRAWLYRVARNRIADLYRRNSTAPAFVDLTPNMEWSPQDSPDDRDPDQLLETINAALAILPPKQREVFRRNEMDGETLREIAADLGVPLKTVISRKGYARQRLRDLLTATYEDYFGEE